MTSAAATAGARGKLMPLVIGAVGVVYGDIGTSPLYTLRTAFTGSYGLSLTPANVLGVLSVIVWALVIVVTLKYITLIMRADNRGEGGILALTALVSRGIEDRARMRWWLVGLGIFGAFTIFDFNRLRRADAESAVAIAASIFLDIFNVFLLGLDLFGGGRD